MMADDGAALKENRGENVSSGTGPQSRFGFTKSRLRAPRVKACTDTRRKKVAAPKSARKRRTTRSKTTERERKKTTKRSSARRKRGLSQSNDPALVANKLEGSPDKRSKISATCGNATASCAPVEFAHEDKTLAVPLAQAMPVSGDAENDVEDIDDVRVLASRLFDALDIDAEECLARRIRGFKKYDYKKKLMEGALPSIKLLKRCLRDYVDAKTDFVDKVAAAEAKMREEMVHAKQAMKAKIKKSEDAREKIESAFAETSDAKERLDTELRRVRDEFETTRNDLQNQLNEATSRAEKTTREFTKQVDSQREAIQTLTTERDALRTDLTARQGEVTSLSEHRATLQDKVAELEKTSSTLRMDVVRVQTELNAAVQRHDDKASQLEQAMKQFESSQAFAQDHIASLTADKKKAEESVATLSDRKSHLEGRVAALERSLSETTSELKSTSEALTTCKAELHTTTTQYRESAEKLAHLQTEHAALREKCTKLEETLCAETKRAEEEKAIADADIAEKDAALAKLKAEAAAMVSQKGEVEKALATKSGELVSVSNELATLKHHHGVSKDTQLARLCAAEKQKDEYKSMLENLQGKMTGLQAEAVKVSELLERLRESEATRRRLHNKVQELRGNIRVFIRTRPFLGDEREELESDGVKCAPLRCRADGVGLRITNPSGKDEESHAYKFDKVFDEKATQQAVFAEVSELVQSALDGYNVCIFSYGQTGSGKTWTMQGDVSSEELRGLIPRSVEQVVKTAETLRVDGWEYSLEGTFLEIYNETIRDLLASSSSSKSADKNKRVHAIKTDAKGHKSVTGLNRVKLHSAKQVADLMKRATENRSVACTDMNAQSSRSHCVFTLHLRGVHTENNVVLNGALHLCDLAGSERLSRSGATGSKLKETKAINKSLSCLADVFHALRQKSSHVPYRNSKLTYLLQECFSKDGKTMMLVNISPTPKSYHESLCSLRFAKKVNQCELGQATARVSRADGKDASTKSRVEKTTATKAKTRIQRPRPRGGARKRSSPTKSSASGLTRKKGRTSRRGTRA